MADKKSYCNKRSGFAGLVMLSTTTIIVFALIFVVTFMQASTARSVAESVEHTIALECLSSCYINNNDTQSWTSNTIFKPVSQSSGKYIDPLSEFNQIMSTYNLMGAGGNERIVMRYDKSSGSPTFELQIYGWNCLDAVWSQLIPIIPNPAKVVIEDIYQPSI